MVVFMVIFVVGSYYSKIAIVAIIAILAKKQAAPTIELVDTANL